MNKQNFLFGRVIKINNFKITIIVKKNYLIKKYKKRINYYSKINVYDMFKECCIGDYVLIRKSRPIKKIIYWILVKIIEKIKII
ncbi:30S ribosomal protein S17 [Candidatus Carsonella ruddii]|uniref:30S ribosomal protein S17 n=1 Tax=Candidatus Carsonella ruddii PC isolate NHV TaxID=1202540 RepID=J3TWN9_CARRU|nr:30S ribosomal protein S17 [Candidatus Carsonella ruddii]AFP84375.1 ribosomal protein S17 [Candidatus Carsonella ruddii PC isolate NHV]